MKLPSTISIALTIMVINADAHPGKPGHTHDEWPFPEIEWSMVGLGMTAVVISVTLYATWRKGRKDAVAG